MKDVQIRKDIERGTMNRVAEGATLLGDGSKPEHHNHVRKTTALETKMREIMTDPQYTDGIDKAREQRSTRLRRAKDVRPL